MWLPKPFSLKDDFTLWIRCFESYSQVAKITKDVMPDMLLSLLDDSAFRAYDQLGLAAEVTSNYMTNYSESYKDGLILVLVKLNYGYSWDSGSKQPSETLDEFCDALIHLANRAYPDLDVDVRMNLVRDRIAGVKAEYIQDRLLEMALKSLDSAREMAKRLEAARSARKQMQMASGTQVVNLQSDEAMVRGTQ